MWLINKIFQQPNFETEFMQAFANAAVKSFIRVMAH